MRLSDALLCLVTLAIASCTATRPLAKFESLESTHERPAMFSALHDSAGSVAATIKLRAPGLRGKASGIVRQASGGQYMVELYGRGKLFLKVYFTASQTVLWPASGLPEFYNLDETPTVNVAMHSMMPSWRLDDVLPVPYARTDSGDDGAWATGAGGKIGAMQHILRDSCTPLVKEYAKPSGNAQFPFNRVVLSTESGSAKLVWSLRQLKH